MNTTEIFNAIQEQLATLEVNIAKHQKQLVVEHVVPLTILKN
jgi:hypothetical protein